MTKTGEFKKYDYGKEKNKIIYGEENSPSYDLSKISGYKIKLICGEYDMISST